MRKTPTTTQFAIIAAGVALIVSAYNLHNIYAIFWKSENVTVVLADCASNCELTGTLGVVPFDGRYYIENESGTTYLEDGAYLRIIIGKLASSSDGKYGLGPEDK